MKILYASLLSALAAASGFANGTRLPSQDAFAVARGYAFTATADNPSAIYYNPAGLTQLDGSQVSVGTHLLSTETSYRGAAGSADLRSRTFVLPYLFASTPLPQLPEQIKLGVGVYAPFGTSTEWPVSSPFATIATKNEVTFIRYALSLAYLPVKEWSLGVSLQYNDADTELHRVIGLSPGDDFGFHGSGHSWSFNAGLLYHPTPQHSFGVQFQSETTIDFAGTVALTPYNFNEAGRVDWLFPRNFSVGYSYRPSEQWNFEIGYDWTNWARLGVLTLNRSVSGPLAVPFRWQNSAYYGFGGTYYRGIWHVSAGYNYSTNSVPDSSWNPAVPDYSRSLFNVGVGAKVNGWTFESALQVSPDNTRTVTGSAPSLAGQSADGTYRSKLWALMFQLAKKW